MVNEITSSKDTASAIVSEVGGGEYACIEDIITRRVKLVNSSRLSD